MPHVSISPLILILDQTSPISNCEMVIILKFLTLLSQPIFGCCDNVPLEPLSQCDAGPLFWSQHQRYRPVSFMLVIFHLEQPKTVQCILA